MRNKSTNPFDDDEDDEDIYKPPAPFSPAFIRLVEKGSSYDEGDQQHRHEQNLSVSSSTPPKMTMDPNKIEYVMFDEENHISEFIPREPVSTQNDNHHGVAPSPYNPDFIKHVASDISPSTSPSRTRSFDSDTSTCNTNCSSTSSPPRSYRQHQDPSMYHDNETSPPSKIKLVIMKVKRATIAGARKVKQYEEEKQLRLKTKEAAVKSYRNITTATVQAAVKTKEWNEKHQVTARTKQQAKRSANYVKKKAAQVSKSSNRAARPSSQ